MRKQTEYLLARAKMEQSMGSYDLAQRLQDTAKQFEARVAVIPQGLPLFSVPLKSTHGASIMVDRIMAELDCEWGFANEPGYDEDVVRVFYNWNNAEKQQRIIERLNAVGCPIEAEWEDEWRACDVCGRYVRTSPNCYSWTPSYAAMDGELVCHECIKEDPSEYIKWLTNHPKRANTILDAQALEAAEFRQFADGLENGLHEFQAASPAKIARWLRERGVDKYLFSIDDVGQFDTTFSVWIKRDQELAPPVNASEWDDSPSPAEIAKAMLRQL